VLLLGLMFEVLAISSDSMYAMLAGTLAGWLKQTPAFMRIQRFFTGGVYLALGIGTALTGRK
jgi:threonine/homoserine/homoserine lactone efflux protein